MRKVICDQVVVSRYAVSAWMFPPGTPGNVPVAGAVGGIVRGPAPAEVVWANPAKGNKFRCTRCGGTDHTLA
jgi:hypothetical protein